MKTFCSVKETVKRIKDKTQNGRKYLQNTYLIKELYPENQQHLQLNNMILTQIKMSTLPRKYSDGK